MREDFGGAMVGCVRGGIGGGAKTILGVAREAGCVFGIGVKGVVVWRDGREEFGGRGEGANGGGGGEKGGGDVGEVRVEGGGGFVVGVIGGGGGGGLRKRVGLGFGFGFDEGSGSSGGEGS